MSSTYTVYLATPVGQRIAVLTFTNLTYTLAVNTVSTLKITLPASFSDTLIQVDSRIEVWRAVDGGSEYLEADKIWLVQIIDRTLGVHAHTVVTCVCPVDLLRRRIVAYSAGTAYTNKTGRADDLIKAFARENLTSGMNSTDRDVVGAANIGAYFTVEGDVGQGAALSIASTRDTVLDVCRKLCAASATAGIYLAFDVIWDGAGVALRTYRDQRGVDHRAGEGIDPIILSPDFGNMADVRMIEDYSAEATVVIAGGQGVGASRTIATASDPLRQGASPFGHREVFAQANTSDTSTQVADVADARLRAGRPQRSITGRISETPGTRYGVHWGYGDRVTVQVDGINYDARIDSVSIAYTPGEETINAAIRIDDA